MDGSRLKRFYLANKAKLDTRLDLVVSLLTLISWELEPFSDSSPTFRKGSDQTKYAEFDLLDEQIVASVRQITNDDSDDDNTDDDDVKQHAYPSEPTRYESTAVVDQSRW